MKVLFLNLWHGKLREPLRQFLGEQESVDVFCFQEASRTENALPKFLETYQKFTFDKTVDEAVHFSQAIYARRDWLVTESVEFFREDNEAGAALSLTVISPDGKTYTLLNLHGAARMYKDNVWQTHDDKKDFPARLRQSQVLLEFSERQNAPTIIGGDFNVSPDTESIELFRRAGYRDLIREYAIPTTRNHFSWDRFPESPKEHYLYSDYALTSPTIVVKSFSVPDVEVSDHLPMILEVE